MPHSDSTRPSAADLRGMATRKLGHLSKDSAAIRERYLFDNDCYAGVCFESGLYSFIWKSPQDFASVMRGEMLIETVSLVANSEIRRAA